MHWLAIVILSVLACITYGVIHDQITARICIEYFTIGHPRILPTEDPTIIGCVWGVIATWWVGVILGVPLATISRIGSRPKRTAGSLLLPMAILFVANALFATAAGIAGYFAADLGWVSLAGSLADKVPPEKHVPFLVDLWAHNASYAGGLIGAVTLMERVWRWRKIAAAGSIPPAK